MFAPDLSFDSPLTFDIGKIIEWNGGFYDILTSTFAEKLLKLPVVGTYQVTTERFRPDLISFRIYGSEQFKIPLLLYNNLTSFLDIQPGLILNYPSLTAMEQILFDNVVR